MCLSVPDYFGLRIRPRAGRYGRRATKSERQTRQTRLVPVRVRRRIPVRRSLCRLPLRLRPRCVQCVPRVQRVQRTIRLSGSRGPHCGFSIRLLRLVPWSP